MCLILIKTVSLSSDTTAQVRDYIGEDRISAFTKKLFLYSLIQLEIKDMLFHSNLVISLSQVHWNKESCFYHSTEAERMGKWKATVL